MIYEIINATHIPKLAELYVETYNAPPWNDEWTVPLAIRKLDEMINCRDSYGLVCFDDENNIIGMVIGSSEIYYNCTQFFIKDFFITLPLQGKGIGSTLMNEFENRLKYRGIDKVYLFTSREEKTKQFYQNRGYKSWNGMVMMGKRLTE